MNEYDMAVKLTFGQVKETTKLTRQSSRIAINSDRYQLRQSTIHSIGTPDYPQYRVPICGFYMSVGRGLAAMQKLCLQCGSIGDTKRFMKGTILTELILWLFFLLPGLIYSIWRHSTVAQVCSRCGGLNVIPLDSPVAQNFLSNQSKTPTSVRPVASTSSKGGMSPKKAFAIVGGFAVLIIIISASQSSGTKGRPSNVRGFGPEARDSSALKPYVLPSAFMINPVAERGTGGEIYISGTANFPDGMKMWVVLGPKKAQQNAIVNGGRFRSGPLYPNVPIVGKQPVEFISYFNGAWQNKAVLSVVGEGGENLHGVMFKLTDPEVIDSTKILDAKFTLQLPPVSPQTSAISTVKHAVLTLPDEGRSAGDIEDNVKLFESPGTAVTQAKGWSATPNGTGIYTVVYDFNDGATGEKQAIWTVNMTTKNVKYVNEAAKLFSWTPKD
jgi:hypothetical protein